MTAANASGQGGDPGQERGGRPGSQKRTPKRASEGAQHSRQPRPPRPPKRDVHGWLVLDKPVGLTSAAALARVKRLLAAKKGGHSGTLDPLATGVLPLAFGRATKTTPWVLAGEKCYRFTVRWGAATDTDDSLGAVVSASELRPAPDAIAAALAAFRGRILQRPPAYSAVKLGGKRAYALARAGEAPEPAPRTVAVHELVLEEARGPEEAVFFARCGGGTYVRAIARDLGEALGCKGHLSELRRLAAGPFGEEQANTLPDLEALAEAGGSGPALLPVEAGLARLAPFDAAPGEAALLAAGSALAVEGLRGRVGGAGGAGADARRELPPEGEVAVFAPGGRLLAVAVAEAGLLRPLRVFPA